MPRGHWLWSSGSERVARYSMSAIDSRTTFTFGFEGLPLGCASDESEVEGVDVDVEVDVASEETDDESGDEVEEEEEEEDEDDVEK